MRRTKPLAELGISKALKPNPADVTWRTVGLCLLWCAAAYAEDKLDALLYKDATGKERP